MKRHHIIIPAILLLLLGQMGFTSCEKYILPSIKLAQDTLACTEYEQTLQVAVTANVKWTLSKDETDTWLTATPKKEVKGDSVIFITVEANTSEEPREATLSVTSEAIRKLLVVRQEGIFL